VFRCFNGLVPVSGSGFFIRPLRFRTPGSFSPLSLFLQASTGLCSSGSNQTHTSFFELFRLPICLVAFSCVFSLLVTGGDELSILCPPLSKIFLWLVRFLLFYVTSRAQISLVILSSFLFLLKGCRVAHEVVAQYASSCSLCIFFPKDWTRAISPALPLT